MVAILVIEDSAEIRTNIVEILELHGFEVIAAQDGATGLELAQQHVPDLILSDIVMPQLDGFQFAQAVRRIPTIAHTPLILLTARTDRTSFRYGMEIGADDYLTKPFSEFELLAAVTARLKRQNADPTHPRP